MKKWSLDSSVKFCIEYSLEGTKQLQQDVDTSYLDKVEKFQRSWFDKRKKLGKREMLGPFIILTAICHYGHLFACRKSRRLDVAKARSRKGCMSKAIWPTAVCRRQYDALPTRHYWQRSGKKNYFFQPLQGGKTRPFTAWNIQAYEPHWKVQATLFGAVRGAWKVFFPLSWKHALLRPSFSQEKSYLCLAGEAWARLPEGWRWNVSHCKRPLQCLLPKKVWKP